MSYREHHRKRFMICRSVTTSGLGLVGLLAGCQSLDVRPATSVPKPAHLSPAPMHRTEAIDEPIQPAAFEKVAATEESLIDLGTALRLAGVENPTIQLAQESIREAQAQQTAARALLLPTVNVGGNLNIHRGNLQQSNGSILAVDKQSLYLGAGAQAIGSGTLAYPGVRLFAHLGDAVYEPLAARQRVATRSADAQAVQNDLLLDVSTAYLELIGAEQRVRVLKQGETDLNELVRLTALYAKSGQGRSADANRAAAHFQLLGREIQSAEEDRQVAVARLARLLNLDPSIGLKSPDGPLPTIQFFTPAEPMEPLLETALRNRPEIEARSAEIALTQVRRRQETVRPFLPLLSVGFSGGAFGGTSNQTVIKDTTLNGRTDFDVAAIWTLQSAGVGNRARVRVADARFGQAVADLERARTEIRQQVAEAWAEVEATVRQIDIAKSALTVAEEGFRLEMQRIQQAEGRPIEILDSFRQLLDARLDLVRAIVGHDIAQFRLYRAVGSMPSVPAEDPVEGK